MATDDKYEIPELVYVHTSLLKDENTPYAISVLGWILLISDFVVTCLLYAILLSKYQYPVYAIGLLIFLITFPLLFAFRLYKKRITWETGHEGLSISRPFYERFIKWSDVISVQTTRWSYIIRTDKTSIKIPVSKKLQFVRLIASVWQHLDKTGKAGDFYLPQEAQGFLKEIPSDVPDMIEWSNQHASLNVIKAICSILLMLLLGIIIWQEDEPGSVFILLNLLLFTVVIIHLVGRMMYEANFVSFRNGLLKIVTLLGTKEIYVEDLEYVEWLSGHHLELSGNDKKAIIPFDKYDPQSCKLLLAVIKSMRECRTRQIIPIPGFLDKLDAKSNKYADVKGKAYR